MRPVYARRVVEVAIFSVRTGGHTSSYTRMPEGTRFFWAMRLNRREPQLWTTERHGHYPVLAVVTPDQRDYYFTTTDPRSKFYPPKGVLP